LQLIPEAVITAVTAPDDGCQHPKHVELPKKYNKLKKSLLVGQLLNSIRDARTHVYKNLGVTLFICTGGAADCGVTAAPTIYLSLATVST